MNEKKRFSAINQLLSHAMGQRYTTNDIAKQLHSSADNVEKNIEYISYNDFLTYHTFHNDNDEEFWTIDAPVEYKAVMFNSEEKQLYNSIADKQLHGYDDVLGIYTKTNIIMDDYRSMINVINKAIENKTKLSIVYKTKDANTIEYDVEPIGVVFYEFEYQFFLVCQWQSQLMFYRLDRMVTLEATEIPYEIIETLNVKEYTRNMWGMEQGESIHVKVKFANVGNVIHKVERDLHHKPDKTIQNFTSHIIYEDTVIGKNNFKKWLRTYGAAATVIEPESLKQEMIESIKKSLNQYL